MSSNDTNRTVKKKLYGHNIRKRDIQEVLREDTVTKYLIAVERQFWCKEVELSCGKQKRGGRIMYFNVRKWEECRKKGREKIRLF